MRLEDLTPSHVRRAVDIYMRLAWGAAPDARPSFDPKRLEGLETMQEVFALCDTPQSPPGERNAASYSLRLGNRRYPFMKFVIQEYLVDREYFFSVDTHDDHFQLDADDPDRPAWLELREFNRVLKYRGRPADQP